MKRLMLAVIMTVLCIGGVSAEEFVDKRFNRRIEPFSRNTGSLRLTPTSVEHLGGSVDIYQDCDLIENTYGMIHYKCGPFYENGKIEDYEYTNYRQFIIKKSEYKDCEYLVGEIISGTEYSSNYLPDAHYCIEKE